MRRRRPSLLACLTLFLGCATDSPPVLTVDGFGAVDGSSRLDADLDDGVDFPDLADGPVADAATDAAPDDLALLDAFARDMSVERFDGAPRDMTVDTMTDGGLPSCQAEVDCQAFVGFPICDDDGRCCGGHACMECLADADCGEGHFCLGYVCVSCRDDADCEAPQPYCFNGVGPRRYCGECRDYLDCPDEVECIEGLCEG